MLLLLLSLSKCSLLVLILNFILLEYFINNRYVHLLLINFFYKQVDHLLK